MTALKKYIPLVIAFALGALITYLAMSLKIMELKFNLALTEAKSTGNHSQPAESNAPKEKKEEKHWLEERLEQESTESKERIEELEAGGDKLKSQFDKFAE